METMTAPEVEVRLDGYPAARAAPPRRIAAATIVAAVYVVLLLGAPLIVRYGSGPDVPSASAAVAVHETVALRCASAPERGQGCKGGAAMLDARHQK